jgi:hypothetical protein
MNFSLRDSGNSLAAKVPPEESGLVLDTKAAIIAGTPCPTVRIS